MDARTDEPSEDGALRRWLGWGVNGVLFLRLLLIPTRKNRFFAFGKLRRLFYIYLRPAKLSGGMLPRRGGACRQCGACCTLGYKCFHFDSHLRRCRVYTHRPQICRVFPIDERDLEERDAVMPEKACGFTFPRYAPRKAEARAGTARS